MSVFIVMIVESCLQRGCLANPGLYTSIPHVALYNIYIDLYVTSANVHYHSGVVCGKVVCYKVMKMVNYYVEVGMM